MGLIGNVFKSNALPHSIEVIGMMLDKLFTTDEEKVHRQAVLEKLKQHPAELQIALNKLEAQHKSLIVCGWRPFIGWVCGLGLANIFIINPWLQWAFGITGPQIPLDVVIELVIAMLGFGTLRTIEKFSGKVR